jgi:hypothetical protein
MGQKEKRIYQHYEINTMTKTLVGGGGGALNPATTIDQCRISFNQVIGFLMISTSLHTRLAAETHLADEQFLHVKKKQRGIPEITRTYSNTGSIQNRRAAF